MQHFNYLKLPVFKLALSNENNSRWNTWISSLTTRSRLKWYNCILQLPYTNTGPRTFAGMLTQWHWLFYIWCPSLPVSLYRLSGSPQLPWLEPVSKPSWSVLVWATGRPVCLDFKASSYNGLSRSGRCWPTMMGLYCVADQRRRALHWTLVSCFVRTVWPTLTQTMGAKLQ